MMAPRNRGIARVARAALAGAGVLLISVLASACTSSGSKSAPTSSGTSAGASVSTASLSTASGSTSPTPHPTTYPALPSATATPAAQKTNGPVRISRTASFGGQVDGAVIAVRSVVGKATQAGEVSGPALAVTVTITNGSAKPIDLTNAVVTLAYGPDRTPGSAISGAPNHFFSGSVAAGKSASGTYVFTVPEAGQSQRLTISVSYSPFARAVVFVGRK